MPDYASVSALAAPFVPAKYLQSVVFAVLAFGYLLSFVASRCSRPADNSWKMPFYKLVNVIAFNFNKAQNADDAKAESKNK